MVMDTTKQVRKLFSEIVVMAQEKSLAEKRQIRVIAASGKGDRQGDIVKVDGIDLTNYKKNPLVLWAHDSMALPIGKCVEMFINAKNQLEMIFEFADAETYAFADTVYRLILKGFIKGVSIGARVREAEWIKNDDNQIIGRLYKALELLEVSIVPVPADSKALITAVKSGAVSDLEFEEYLSKSLDVPLDLSSENPVSINTDAVKEKSEDDPEMKAQLEALEKRLAALEELAKASAAKGDAAQKSMDTISNLVSGLQLAVAKNDPAAAQNAVKSGVESLNGHPMGEIAKRALDLIEGMTKRVK
jgi:HK97 family phage prohead protease